MTDLGFGPVVRPVDGDVIYGLATYISADERGNLEDEGVRDAYVQVTPGADQERRSRYAVTFRDRVACLTATHSRRRPDPDDRRHADPRQVDQPRRA